jgi:signal transduction histidine kinase
MANLSHELRTPLHGMPGLVDLALQEHGIGKGSRGYLTQICQSGKLLLVAINDVLGHSNIVAGKLPVELESIPFRLQPVVAHVVRLVGEVAKAKGGKLKHDTVWPLTCVPLPGDFQRLQQVWMNLLSSAIRFTQAGGVVRLKGWLEIITADDMAVLWFQVRDSGIGMTPEAVSHFFEPFTQADSSTAGRFEFGGRARAWPSVISSWR